MSVSIPSGAGIGARPPIPTEPYAAYPPESNYAILHSGDQGQSFLTASREWKAASDTARSLQDVFLLQNRQRSFANSGGAMDAAEASSKAFGSWLDGHISALDRISQSSGELHSAWMKADTSMVPPTAVAQNRARLAAAQARLAIPDPTGVTQTQAALEMQGLSAEYEGFRVQNGAAMTSYNTEMRAIHEGLPELTPPPGDSGSLAGHSLPGGSGGPAYKGIPNWQRGPAAPQATTSGTSPSEGPVSASAVKSDVGADTPSNISDPMPNSVPGAPGAPAPDVQFNPSAGSYNMPQPGMNFHTPTLNTTITSGGATGGTSGADSIGAALSKVLNSADGTTTHVSSGRLSSISGALRNLAPALKTLVAPKNGIYSNGLPARPGITSVSPNLPHGNLPIPPGGGLSGGRSWRPVSPPRISRIGRGSYAVAGRGHTFRPAPGSFSGGSASGGAAGIGGGAASSNGASFGGQQGTLTGASTVATGARPGMPTGGVVSTAGSPSTQLSGGRSTAVGGTGMMPMGGMGGMGGGVSGGSRRGVRFNSSTNGNGGGGALAAVGGAMIAGSVASGVAGRDLRVGAEFAGVKNGVGFGTRPVPAMASSVAPGAGGSGAGSGAGAVGAVGTGRGKGKKDETYKSRVRVREIEVVQAPDVYQRQKYDPRFD